MLVVKCVGQTKLSNNFTWRSGNDLLQVVQCEDDSAVSATNDNATIRCIASNTMATETTQFDTFNSFNKYLFRFKHNRQH